MNHAQVFQNLLQQIDRMQKIVQKRKWDLRQDLIVERPAKASEVESIEKKLGIQLPDDYKLLFTEYSRHLEFSYQMEEEPSDEFRGIFSGEISWDLDRFIDQYEHYQSWTESWLNPEFLDEESMAAEKKIVMNKVPFMEVANGDLIVMGYNPSEIVYLSHEGDTMHGKHLGESLWAFLEFHSRVGFVGSEDWQFEPFFNYEQDKMITQGEKVDRFINWLNN